MLSDLDMFHGQAQQHESIFEDSGAGLHTERHPILDGTLCDMDGDDLEPGSQPPLSEDGTKDDYSPFANRAEFELAELLYVEEEMSAGKIDRLLNLLAALYDEPPPFASHQEMYSLIDLIKQGEIPWNSFSIMYDGVRPQDGQPTPPWMDEKYEVWFRDPLQVLENQISNPEFKDMMDFSPKRVYHKGEHRYEDLMSGNWAWDQADEIAKDESTHGAMFAPVILGSDKTTVSVATGQNDFYPLYASLGNVHNSVRRAHRNAVSLIGFLSIPKTSKEYAEKADFRKFRRQLFHSSLEHILSSLCPHMTTPRITRCCDGHFRRVIYGLGPYIADYPEQALLACIVQNWCPKCTAPYDDLDGEVGGSRAHIHTNTLLSSGTITLQELWDDYGIVGDLLPFTTAFPRADIHELLSPDLLHQIIKGTFKDHIVDWVEQCIKAAHPKAQADRILADIDRRIAAVPSFPGLRHFHEGRGFKQWTGDDSKGLMKVYLPAIAGHVPPEMVKAVAALIDLCYLVRQNVIDEKALAQIKSTLDRFHQYREIFRELGIRPDGFSLPRQHSLSHYVFSITQFGAPNGLCSSITESKHVKAVKKPYRRSSRNKPLGQMLVTNQRVDKIAAARTDFTARGMLNGASSTANLLSSLHSNLSSHETRPEPTTLQPAQPVVNLGSSDPSHEDHTTVDERERHDAGPEDDPEADAEISLAKTYMRNLPRDIYELAHKIKQPDLPLLARRFLYGVLNHNSPTPAAAVPIDNLPDITEKVYVYNSARVVYYAPSDVSGLRGMHRERIRSVRSCDTPDDETGMWIVEPDYLARQKRSLEVVHLDTILRGAHLIGVAGPHFLPSNPKVEFSMALDSFKSFYVNNAQNEKLWKL
ncbi:hypothetical protein NLJ89_g7528 [Agrocybe chaxingu]|uniref:Uncharacterized protein n=1 Tax=Agrocybe chaxingu TaxID=84603 RepID=A0A9W8JZ02_9AGAR|nr:hypothetical protein NLJ89_g7528 [Agrocybe chaxingu]